MLLSSCRAAPPPRAPRTLGAWYVLQFPVVEQRVSLREVNQHLTRYVKAAEAGDRIVITRRGQPVALLSPLPLQDRPLSPEQEEALERILSRSYHLGGRAPSRDELHERRPRSKTGKRCFPSSPPRLEA